MTARRVRDFREVRDVAKRDEGFSLVELLVAIMLMGIVLIVVANLFISTSKSTAQSGEVHESTGNASNIANAVGSVVPFAVNNPKTGATDPDPAILVARADRLVIMAAIGVPATLEASGRPTKPTLVEYTVAADRQLLDRRWIPAASGSTWVFAGTDPTTVAPASTRRLGGSLTTGAPIFTYRDVDDNLLNPGTGALTLAQRRLVATVEVRISVVPPGDPTATPVVITTRYPLANLGLREVS